jgi:hypothetical protein
MDLQATIAALTERVAKLEAAKPRRRVYNPKKLRAKLACQ